MPEPPLITVAIPTMNGTRHLPATLRAALAQEGLAFDLLVSDDRSDDETLALAREVAGDRARLVTNSERVGLAGNWNQCVALSRTPLVAVVHQDDVIHPRHLAVHVEGFGRHERVGLVATASRVIDDSGAEVAAGVVERGGFGKDDRVFAPGEALPLLAAGNPLRCSAVSIRAEAHAEIGGFDPGLRYAVDWDFWLKVARTWSLAWRGETTVDVRWHLASETHRFAKGVSDLEETERVMGALLTSLEGDGNWKKGVESAARKRMSRAYLNRAYVAAKGGDARLGKACLEKSLRLWPGVVSVIAADPRLAARMAAVWAAPGLSGRWAGKRN